MKILLVILDGLADRPQKVLGGKTPLEAAHIPQLDRLAELGINGLLVPGAPGVPLESEFSHFLLFGYPADKFPGRAAFETIGRGFEIAPHSVVLLASFASTTVIDGKVRRDSIVWEERRPQDEDDCRELCTELTDYESCGIRFFLQSCSRCEAILTLFGGPSRYVSDVDPFYNGAFVARALPLVEDPDQGNAERTAAALNDYLSWAHRRLTSHPLNRKRQGRGLPPLNFLLTKWAAAPPDVPSFQEQNGLHAASVENYPLYIGIARICGMTPVAVPQHNSVAEDFREKLRTAEDLFRQGYEFVHLHSKGPDVAAHRKDPLGKKSAIEAIDSVLGPLVKQIEHHEDILVVVTGDHATPSSGPLIHSGEAVPLIITGGPNVLVDEVKNFHERAAIAGGLGRIHSADLMPVLLNLTDRVRLHGVRHQRQPRPYWLWQVEPFVVSPLKKI
ncbi:MAG: alkaline phosphatase family protein [Candidatus Binatia bacterium]